LEDHIRYRGSRGEADSVERRAHLYKTTRGMEGRYRGGVGIEVVRRE
jgi:hypothetical protein